MSHDPIDQTLRDELEGSRTDLAEHGLRIGGGGSGGDRRRPARRARRGSGFALLPH